jgi:hypothetical protein
MRAKARKNPWRFGALAVHAIISESPCAGVIVARITNQRHFSSNIVPFPESPPFSTPYTCPPRPGIAFSGLRSGP